MGISEDLSKVTSFILVVKLGGIHLTFSYSFNKAYLYFRNVPILIKLGFCETQLLC